MFEFIFMFLIISRADLIGIEILIRSWIIISFGISAQINVLRQIAFINWRWILWICIAQFLVHIATSYFMIGQMLRLQKRVTVNVRIVRRRICIQCSQRGIALVSTGSYLYALFIDNLSIQNLELITFSTLRSKTKNYWLENSCRCEFMFFESESWNDVINTFLSIRIV